MTKWLAIAFSIFIVIVIILADMGTLPGLIRSLYDFPNGDKLGHFILYGILSLLLNLAFTLRPGLNLLRTILTVSLTLAALIGLEEWSQSLFGSRTMDIVDLLASYAGVAVAALTAWQVRKWPLRV
ncbi:MAG: VanZ family protein [Chloroflexi bacterium]|nr:VanZ family protein [Chloroflexota bacterium]